MSKVSHISMLQKCIYPKNRTDNSNKHGTSFKALCCGMRGRTRHNSFWPAHTHILLSHTYIFSHTHIYSPFTHKHSPFTYIYFQPCIHIYSPVTHIHSPLTHIHFPFTYIYFHSHAHTGLYLDDLKLKYQTQNASSFVGGSQALLLLCQRDKWLLSPQKRQ